MFLLFKVKQRELVLHRCVLGGVCWDTLDE